MDYAFVVLTLTCIYALLATSLNLIKGYGGLFSIAHAVFFGVGAYTFAVLRVDYAIPFIPAIFAAFVLAGASSLVISIPSLRVSGEYLLLATFAIQELGTSLFLNLPITGGPAGIRDIPPAGIFGFSFRSNTAVFAITAAVSLICWWVMFEIARSPFGRVMKAIREDEIAAGTLGKNTVGFKIAIFFIGCGFAGVGGALYATAITFINPDSFNIYMSFTIVIMVLVGGLANPFGGVLGATLLTALEEILRVALPSSEGAQVAQVVFGVFLVAVVLWRPEGILPEHAKATLVRDAEALEGRGDKYICFAHAREAPPDVRASVGSPILSVEDISKSYGGVNAVRDAKMSVGAGEIVGIVGPNGAGKTTLFDIIGGAVPPDAGDVRLKGNTVSRLKPFMLARQGIGRLFQQVRPFSDMTVLENVLVAFPGVARENPLFAWLPIDREADRERVTKAQELLRYVGLDGYANESAGSLSFGQQKLIGFARLLAQGASVWLLDEPAAGIDPHMRLDIRRTIAKVREERGVTVLIVEHNMDFLEELVDRVVFMAEGRVVRTAGFAEIMKDEELNRLYLGG